MLRVILTLTLLLAACGGTTQTIKETTRPPSAPSVRATPRYDAKTFFETTTLRGASFSPDGSKILFSSDEGGVFNVWSVATAGGDATQHTKSRTDSRFAVAYFRTDDRFLYTGDKGGNEESHLYVRELDGSDRDLTPGEKLKALFGGVSQDGAHFYVYTNERDPKFFDVYRYKANGYARERIFENTEGWSPGPIEQIQGQYIAVTKVRNNVESNVYLIDLKHPKVKPKLITPHEGNANHHPIEFSPDGKSLIYMTDAHGEFRQAWRYNMESGEHTAFIQRDWDVRSVATSEKGRYYAVSVNENAKTRVELWDAIKGEQIQMPALPEGEVTGITIAKAEDRLAFYVSSDREPPNLFSMTVGDVKANKLTDARNPEINPANLVEGEAISYPSFDALQIPAILYKPRDASPAAKAPAVVFVHGGPGGQSRRTYRPMVQHLVNHGYAVLAVNNRGSSGYGKTFNHMDDKKHGDVDLKDCVWSRKYLEGLDWVDGAKVAIMGGSYGGFMVAAALAFEPTAFDLGINIFGVTNWVRTLENIPPWWASFREYLYAELGDPATDRERLMAISPLFHAQNIQRPLLVVQGANDPRVLKVESDEIVAAVKKNGVVVEYLVFNDEGHGFRKKINRIAASEAYLKFLEAHLRGETSSARLP